MKNEKVPKGYKETVLGIIPDNWSVAQLKDKFDRVVTKNKNGVKNVLTISAQQGLINQEEYFNKSVASKDLSNYILLKKGDFAYNKSYSNGYPYGAIKKLNRYEEGVVSSLYICFKPNAENKTPDFYEQYFEAGLFNHEIHAIAQEGARNHGLLNVSINDFFNSYIIDAPDYELNKITKILSIWDKAIELKGKLIVQKKEQKKELMQSLLTGKKRLDGFKDEWKEIRLDKIAKVSIGLVTTMTTNYVENGVPLIRNSDISPNRISKELIQLDREFAEKHKGRMLKTGDIVTVHTGDVGVSAVIEKKLDGCVGFATLNTRIIDNSYDPYFVSYYFNSKKFINFALKMSTGDGRNNFNLKDFKNSIVPSISLEEQKAIVKVLNLFDKEIYLIEHELKELKLQKKALMQQLLIGKIRVKV